MKRRERTVTVSFTADDEQTAEVEGYTFREVLRRGRDPEAFVTFRHEFGDDGRVLIVASCAARRRWKGAR